MTRHFLPSFHSCLFPFLVFTPLSLFTGCDVAIGTAPQEAPATRVAFHSAHAPQVAVTVLPAALHEWAERIALDAEVVGLTSPVISAEVSATVDQIPVLPGQKVKKGDVLAMLDQRALVLLAREADAQFAQLGTQLADKQRALGRHEELFAKGYISRAALEIVQTELRLAQQQLMAAKARSELARHQLSKAAVTAPHDGIVSDRHVAPGTYVRPGDKLISLWHPGTSTLRLQVPQHYAGLMKPGQALTVRWDAQALQTELTHVQTDINPVSRSFEVHASVPPPLRSLTGAVLPVTLELQKDSVLAVPAQAIQLNGTSAFLFIVDHEGKAQKKPVTLGRTRNGQTEIIQGISEGERIVVEGAAFIQDRQALLISNDVPLAWQAPPAPRVTIADGKGASSP